MNIVNQVYGQSLDEGGVFAEEFNEVVNRYLKLDPVEVGNLGPAVGAINHPSVKLLCLGVRQRPLGRGFELRVFDEEGFASPCEQNHSDYLAYFEKVAGAVAMPNLQQTKDDPEFSASCTLGEAVAALRGHHLHEITESTRLQPNNLYGLFGDLNTLHNFILTHSKVGSVAQTMPVWLLTSRARGRLRATFSGKERLCFGQTGYAVKFAAAFLEWYQAQCGLRSYQMGDKLVYDSYAVFGGQAQKDAVCAVLRDAINAISMLGQRAEASADSLAASQVVERLASLSPDELEAVRRYETAGRRRRTVLNRIDQLAR